MRAASVVLITYNDDQRLELCLSGYAAQSLKDFELLIVNDGGSRPGGVDNTRDLVERFASQLDVRYLYLEPESENFRLAAARNLGIRQAGGKTLIISDGDCVPHPNLVQLLIQYARDDRLLIGIRKRIAIDAVASLTTADLPNLPNLVWLDDERLCVSETTRQTFLGLKDSVPPKGWQHCWGCLFAAPLWKFKALGGFDERFVSWGGEDHDMAERLVRGAGCRLYSLPEAVVYHLDHPGRGGNREQSRALLAELRKDFLPIRNGGPMPPTPAAVADKATTEPASKRPAVNQKVSLCLIAKNEEDNLAPCLISAADLVDEMVVVDTGSTDRTKELAASSGARVFDFTWVDDFAAARNESVGRASGDWILWLDGDEHFDDDNRQKLRALFAGLKDENAAYVMKQRSAPEHPGGSPTVVDQVRLFRNRPEVRWRYRVHEQILPALRAAGHDVRFTDIFLEHTGYQDPALLQRKTERNLQLLRLQDAERPDDPFTLFNLGWLYQDLKQAAKAIPLLRRSLALSQPGDSIVRKLYTLLAQGHRQLVERREALAACRAGRARCPDDPELLFLEAQLLREQGDLAGAEACLRHLLQLRPGFHFASLDAGVRGHKARHQLALACWEQGRAAEAEEQWRAVVAEQPRFGPAWQGLAELYLAQGRWPELQEAVGRMQVESSLAVEAMVLQARGHLARQEFGPAQQLLEEAIGRVPQAVAPRVILTHVLLQSGNAAAAEPALRAVLERDPRHAASWSNLALLLRSQNRLGEGIAVVRSGAQHCPEEGSLLFLEGTLLQRQGDLQGAESCLLRLLETETSNNDPGARERRTSARHHLAMLYRSQRRFAEAEVQWHAVVADRPDFAKAWSGLGEVYVGQERWPEVEEVVARLQANPAGWLDGALLHARGLLARQEFAKARQVLEEGIARAPGAVAPHELLSYVLLREGNDWSGAEQALRKVLELDPANGEARSNLAVLLRQQGRESELPSANGTPSPGDSEPHVTFSEPLAKRRLRIAFAGFSPFPYSVDTPYQAPLGGSESALCYLAEALAQQGHEVYLLNSGPVPGVSRGVRCLPLAAATFQQLPPLDALIVQNLAGKARELRALLAPGTPLLLWSQHAHDQPAVQPLHDPAERDAYDGIALVSDWQRQQYLEHFGIDPERTAVLRNAIGPAFQGLFPDGAGILAQKAQPPVLAYTSTPFRGLDLLLDAFPRIRKAVPQTSLKVFSSMRVYNVPEVEDHARFGRLYQKCAETEGVEYRGSLPQPELAGELRAASVLAYPNTFAETSCIAVLEAMASGCTVITTDLAALPETTAGFARLIPANGDPEGYLNHFIEETVQTLRQLANGDAAGTEARLEQQVRQVNEHGTWPARALEWEQWLHRIHPQRAVPGYARPPTATTTPIR